MVYPSTTTAAVDNSAPLQTQPIELIYRGMSVQINRATSVVEQSFQPGVSAAQVAREHNINANLLHTWRWHYRSGLLAYL